MQERQFVLYACVFLIVAALIVVLPGYFDAVTADGGGL